MTRLSPEQVRLLRLIERSPDAGEGWRSVSPVLWPHIHLANLPSELVETEDRHDGGGRIRLTEKGDAVMRYV